MKIVLKLSGLSSTSGVFKWPDNTDINIEFWCHGQPSNSSNTGGNRLTLVEAACLVGKYTSVETFCLGNIDCHISKKICCEKN